MFKILTKTRHWLASEDGPTAVEYAVMLALIILACFAIVQNIGTSLSSAFSSINSTVGSASS
jgi:pilus assembly protein Flp/PilA